MLGPQLPRLNLGSLELLCPGCACCALLWLHRTSVHRHAATVHGPLPKLATRSFKSNLLLLLPPLPPPGQAFPLFFAPWSPRLVKVAAFLALIASIKVRLLGLVFTLEHECIGSCTTVTFHPYLHRRLTHTRLLTIYVYIYTYIYTQIMSGQPTSPAVELTSSQQHQGETDGQHQHQHQQSSSSPHPDGSQEGGDMESSFMSNSSERHPKGKRKRTAYVALPNTNCSSRNHEHATDPRA